MSQEDRIKYYPKNDIAHYHFLGLVESFIRAFDNDFHCNTINDAIELYNIQLYVDDGERLKNWDDETYAQIKRKAEVIPNLVADYYKHIANDNIIDHLTTLDRRYYESFWMLITKYKVYKRISYQSFSSYIINNPIHINCILKHKPLVGNYDKDLRATIISDVKNAEILLRKFLLKNKEKIYLPASLDSNDKRRLIESYVDWDKANIDYLSKIAKSSQGIKNKDLDIEDKTRLKAKKRCQSYWQESFKRGEGIIFSVEVSFADNMDNLVEITRENPNEMKVRYDLKWIEDNLDFPTLLNNFIYLFEFVSTQAIFMCTAERNKMSTIEDAITTKGTNDYPVGIAFQQCQGLQLKQLELYHKVLENNNIYIESIVAWFFNEYIPSEFGIYGFDFPEITLEASYEEKIKTALTKIEGILKKYKLFVENGSIDPELYSISSKSIPFNQIPSLITPKYAYPKSEEIKKEMYFLFSDQSPISYIRKYQGKYRTFADNIIHENVCLEDVEDFKKDVIDWLLKRGTIIAKDGVIKAAPKRFLLLKALSDDGVIAIYKKPALKSEIKSLIEKGDLELETSLLSKPEVNYLNFILNRKAYSNGFDLRNRYLHDSIISSEEQAKEDYFYVLKIIILIMIKINDELCYMNAEKQGSIVEDY